MHKTILECSVITPMFLKGANTRVELRPSSLKGVLRYFYRALSSSSSIEKLREEEEKYFGSSNPDIGASKIRLNIKDVPDKSIDKERLIYTDNHNYKEECYLTDKKFSIIASSHDKSQFYTNIIILTLLLGGLGKRSRRGRGSIQVLSCTDDEIPILNERDSFIEQIQLLLEDLFPSKYISLNNKIILNNSNNLCINKKYPYVKEIEIGNEYKSWKSILENIDSTSHEYRKKSGAYCLGYAGNGEEKFASPIYITVIKLMNGYYPLITTLNTVMNKKWDYICEKIQNDYKESILRGNGNV